MSRTRNPINNSPRLWQAGLAASSTVELDRERAHYLLDVMRRKVGDRVRLFNAEDGEWSSTIAAADRKRCRLTVEDQLRAPAEEETGPTLLFAPIKKARMELLVEKATELGVGRLLPVRTRRSVVDRINLERLQTIAIEAAEQCERLTVPEILELQTLDRVLDAWPDDVLLYVADETGGGEPLLQALQPARPAAFLIGPEGGFDPAELARLGEHPAVVKVDLGPRILRAETAAMAVLATWAVQAI
jgi:16S rRNA (uracil1498-N3)-methyltransferase